MAKKRVAILLAALLLLLTLTPTAFAAEKKLRMVKTDLPQIRAEYSGSISASDIDEARLGNDKLKVSSVKDGTDASRLVYILIDVSTSMRSAHLNSLKPSLKAYIKSLNKSSDNKAVLLTFGDGVKTLLKGGESDADVDQAIDGIRPNSNHTSFYTAVNKVFDMAGKETKYERNYVIVVSDGWDEENTGSSSEQEVTERYKTHKLPLYGLCQDATKKTSADTFGSFARASGGELVLFGTRNAGDRFDELTGIADNVSLVTLKSSKKKSGGTQLFRLKVGKDELKQEVPVTGATDEIAPEVKEIEFDKEKNAFIITFSEAVEHAGTAAAYTIEKGSRTLVIDNVELDDSGAVATVKMEKTVYSGTYDFTFSKKITDATDNANKLEQNTLTQKVDAVPLIFKILKIAGIILLPILFLLAIYLLLLAVKRKKKVNTIKDIFIEQVEEEQHEAVHIKEKQGLSVMLYIDGADGSYHSLRYNVISSIIVGNSDMCDIRIDDNRMSRQHFAVERVENGLAVTDLASKNGTYINGVQIHSRTFLRSSDRVFAGNTTIRFIYQ